MKVYEIDLSDYQGAVDIKDMIDEQFITEAERQDNSNLNGGVWSLKSYEEWLNDENYPTNSYIRFI